MSEMPSFSWTPAPDPERTAWAKRVHGWQLDSGAEPERIGALIEKADEVAEEARQLCLLLRALRLDPDWRKALLFAGVSVVTENAPDSAQLGGPPTMAEAVDAEEAKLIFGRAVDLVKAEGGPSIADPVRLLRPFANEYPRVLSRSGAL